MGQASLTIVSGNFKVSMPQVLFKMRPHVNSTSKVLTPLSSISNRGGLSSRAADFLSNLRAYPKITVPKLPRQKRLIGFQLGPCSLCLHNFIILVVAVLFLAPCIMLIFCFNIKLLSNRSNSRVDIWTTRTRTLVVSRTYE